MDIIILPKIKDLLISIVCHILRYFPIRHESGLIKIGNPTPESPIFISGDYFSTAKRVIKALQGVDCFLLIVDSAGINVWCAAGVGDLNEHKIADSVNAVNLKDIVKHRTLIIPQLAAVGIDRENLLKECGFQIKWGPANLDDVGEFIKNNYEITEKMRLVRFAFRDRVSLALGQLFNYFFFYIYYFIYTLFFGNHLNHYAIFIAIILTYTISATVVNFKMPFKWPPSNVIFASIIPYAGIFIYTYLINPSRQVNLTFYIIATFIITILICMDMLGSTVYYKTTIGHWLKTFSNKSLFQPMVNDNCNGCRNCMKVCPKGLFSKNSKKRVDIDLSKECCECLACVRHCPNTAIVNIHKGRYKHDIKCIPSEVMQKVMH